MIILNIDLGTELEREFYDKIRNKKMNYLQYVEELIKDDLEKDSNDDNRIESSEDGEEIPTSNY